MVVHARRRALREHDAEDVEAPVGIGVEQVADRSAVERFAGPRRHVAACASSAAIASRIASQRARSLGRSASSAAWPRRRGTAVQGSEARASAIERSFHGVIEPLALAHLPTPLERVDRLGAALGLAAGRLFVKRDDCTGLAGGGNKARKLNYLCADAMAEGADMLVTGGGRQSNHVRMTIAAANILGIEATAVLASDEPAKPSGNVVLDYVLAPTFVWAGPLRYYPLEEKITAVCEELRAAGRKPYQIPIGGATPLGAVGYIVCVDEILQQLGAMPSLVITADGSGGTHAGLVAGLGDHALVLGRRCRHASRPRRGRAPRGGRRGEAGWACRARRRCAS